MDLDKSDGDLQEVPIEEIKVNVGNQLLKEGGDKGDNEEESKGEYKEVFSSLEGLNYDHLQSFINLTSKCLFLSVYITSASNIFNIILSLSIQYRMCKNISEKCNKSIEPHCNSIIQ